MNRSAELQFGIRLDGVLPSSAAATFLLQKPVTLVVGSLASWMTFEEVRREYNFTDEDIRALKFGLKNRK